MLLQSLPSLVLCVLPCFVDVASCYCIRLTTQPMLYQFNQILAVLNYYTNIWQLLG